MASYTANVTQSGDGKTLTFTDTSVIVAPLTTRILTIYDANDSVLQVVNLGTSLTYNYTISKDAYYKFVEVITDASGSHPVNVNFLSMAFYQIAFANLISQRGCSCNCGDDYSFTWGERFYKAANIQAMYANAVAADSLIKDANLLINT